MIDFKIFIIEDVTGNTFVRHKSDFQNDTLSIRLGRCFLNLL